MNNISWYTYRPIDTILVRGAEDDSSSNTTIFPPPAQTIAGAVRTAFLKERGITISEYINHKADKSIYDAIGKPEDSSPFTIIGPLFEMEGNVFVPVPATWFYEKDDEKEDIDEHKKTLTINSNIIVRSRKVNQNDFTNKRIYSSKPIRVWPEKLEKSIEPLSGYYINIKDLYFTKGQEKITFYQGGYFYSKEERVGVALYDNRSTREGKLYGFSHFRLRNNVRLLFGITKGNILSEKGSLKIGAEQRFGLYEAFNNDQLKNIETPKNAESYLALSYIFCSQEKQQKILAFDRIAYFGGWNLAKGFHKPMQAYYPPGSVFAEYIENTIPIREDNNA